MCVARVSKSRVLWTKMYKKIASWELKFYPAKQGWKCKIFLIIENGGTWAAHWWYIGRPWSADWPEKRGVMTTAHSHTLFPAQCLPFGVFPDSEAERSSKGFASASKHRSRSEKVLKINEQISSYCSLMGRFSLSRSREQISSYFSQRQSLKPWN